MNKKELFECLSSLSKTNNLRDGIDIRKEEANVIVKEIERLQSIIKEVREYIENEWNCNFSEICKKQPQKLLEILDKENK